MWLTSHLLQLRGSFKSLGQKGDFPAVLRLHSSSSLRDFSSWFWRSPVISGRLVEVREVPALPFFQSRVEGAGSLSQGLAQLACNIKVVVLGCLML